MEGPEAKAQPSIATLAIEEDTCPKVLIRGEWRKVRRCWIATPKDAYGQLECDEQFINELAKQPVVDLHVACHLNPGAKPKSTDTQMDLIYKHAYNNYL